MNVSRNSLLNNFKSLQSCSWIFYEDETRGFSEGAKDEREKTLRVKQREFQKVPKIEIVKVDVP